MAMLILNDDTKKGRHANDRRKLCGVLKPQVVKLGYTNDVLPCSDAQEHDTRTAVRSVIFDFARPVCLEKLVVSEVKRMQSTNAKPFHFHTENVEAAVHCSPTLLGCNASACASERLRQVFRISSKVV